MSSFPFFNVIVKKGNIGCKNIGVGGTHFLVFTGLPKTIAFSSGTII